MNYHRWAPCFRCTCGKGVRGHLARASHRRACPTGEWLAAAAAYDALVAQTLQQFDNSRGSNEQIPGAGVTVSRLEPGHGLDHR